MAQTRQQHRAMRRRSAQVEFESFKSTRNPANFADPVTAILESPVCGFRFRPYKSSVQRNSRTLFLKTSSDTEARLARVRIPHLKLERSGFWELSYEGLLQNNVALGTKTTEVRGLYATPNA
jgi:hypothetical protein